MKSEDLSKVLESLEDSEFFKSCVTERVEIPSRQGDFRDFPRDLEPVLRTVLEKRGIGRLYSHQREAFRFVQAGHDIVIVTPTASGKTLCYNLPVLDRILKDPSKNKALYLFPTKALSQDQFGEMQELITGTGACIRAHTYDGDTPGDIRRKVRKEAHVVISNPDMLHAGILPHHTKWNGFFASLSFVIIDEMHNYRGVFGSHMVNVMRRLTRVCRHYGSKPRYICCSATIGNPLELARKLIERDVKVVDQSGAPQAEKRLYFVNPPVVQKELGLRGSALTMSQKVAARFLRSGVSTIVFTTTRLNVEILTKYLKDLFKDSGLAEEKGIRGYRGGYLPNMRREIEKGLREGRIKGVVSTNALELGVDIGSLEACVICGYPGSIASTWQQAGRAGRKAGMSCAVMVAKSTPLDQYIIRNPDYFFGRSPEHARVNADNLSIVVGHIKCSAFELPFQEGEAFGEEDLETILNYLAEKRVLKKVSGRWYWAEDAYPAEGISLRSISAENFLVMDRSEGNRVVGEVDFESAPLTIYPGAMYMVESQQYEVEDLDYKNRKAYVRAVSEDYYTEAVLYTHVRILDRFSHFPEGRGESGPEFCEGEVHVVNHVAGYKKLKFYTVENLGYGEVTLPDQEMHTTAFWIRLNAGDALEMGMNLQELLEAMDGAAFAMQHMGCFLLMCEPGDLRKCIGDPYTERFLQRAPGAGRMSTSVGLTGGCVEWGQEQMEADFQPSMFLFDAYPGGVGFSGELFTRRKELLKGSLLLIEDCSCTKGCPSCVGPGAEMAEDGRCYARRLMEWLISKSG